MTDSVRTIARSAARFFFGTILSRFSGLLRDMSMAFVFGAHGAVAAFLMAFRFAHLLRRLLGEGPMQSAFIPYYEGIRKTSPATAGRFFRDLTVSVSALLVGIIVLSMAGLGSWLSFGDPSPDTTQVLRLTIVMLPSLLFICLFGLHMGMLQCERSYFIPSFAPTIFNLIWVAGVFWVQGRPVEEAMVTLSSVVVIACLGQWMVTLPKTWQIWRNVGTHPWKEVLFFSKDVRALFKPLTLGMIGVAATQINSAMDTLFARYATVEGPAQLWYALRIQQLPVALFGVALSGALLPPLARALKQGNTEQFVSFFNFSMVRALTLTIPVTVVLIALGGETINFIYGRGNFTNEAAIGTSYCLWGYLFGLVPASLVLVLAPALYAQNDYRTPMIASILSMTTNTVLNSIAIFGLGWGCASVAYATSISAWINSAFLAWHIARRNDAIHFGPVGLSALKVTLVSALAMACGLCLGGGSFAPLCRGESYLFTRDFAAQCIQIVVPGVGFGVGMLFFAKLLRIEELLALLPWRRSEILEIPG
jgi:putative peptidoglycan lipid II flippase